jgi:hypothetical protein
MYSQKLCRTRLQKSLRLELYIAEAKFAILILYKQS